MNPRCVSCNRKYDAHGTPYGTSAADLGANVGMCANCQDAMRERLRPHGAIERAFDAYAAIGPGAVFLALFFICMALGTIFWVFLEVAR